MVTDAEVVVVEELLREPLRGVAWGVAAPSPGAIIARKAVLEREGILPLPRPQIQESWSSKQVQAAETLYKSTSFFLAASANPHTKYLRQATPARLSQFEPTVDHFLLLQSLHSMLSVEDKYASYSSFHSNFLGIPVRPCCCNICTRRSACTGAESTLRNSFLRADTGCFVAIPANKTVAP